MFRQKPYCTYTHVGSSKDPLKCERDMHILSHVGLHADMQLAAMPHFEPCHLYSTKWGLELCPLWQRFQFSQMCGV